MPKNIRYLTERRKSQLRKQTIYNNKYSQSLRGSISNIVPKAVEEVVLTSQNVNNNTNISHLLSENIHEPHDLSVALQSNTEGNKNINIASEDDISTFIHISSCNEKSLWEDLQTLIIQCNIPHNTANKLLHILKYHGHAELPTDVRVLLRTLRNVSRHIKAIGNGHYIHFGIAFCLERFIQIYSAFIKNDNIELNMNIDGLPISKSSGSQFWPIMASIEKIDIHTTPFIIGIYHGMHKPVDANDFLLDFVNEFITLSKNGITIGNKKYTVVINAILCDAPAKSFITYTKDHTGYFSCSKCTQEGTFVSNRVTFPEICNTLRTDETFKNRNQIEHHIGDSILEKLSIGMVSQIPLDYMHLVCLGVMKKILQLWVRGPRNIRLLPENINVLSYNLIMIRPYIPSEFSRKPRDLRDIDRWKATEFRQFLLYSGIVLLKPILSRNYYNHFVSLSIGIRILIDPQLCLTFHDYAKSLLSWFVSNYQKIYGDEHLSHNVHNLLHLANDVKIFGSLNNWNCFKYENHMQKIKKKLHNSGKPLEEFSNRVFEELEIPIQPCHMIQYPIPVYTKDNKISHIEFKTFKLSRKKNDNCALLYNNDIISILDIFEGNNMIYIRGERFLNKKSLFTVPCTSEKLGIFVVRNTITDNIDIPVTQIKSKCLKIKNPNDVNFHVVIPFLNTN